MKAWNLKKYITILLGVVLPAVILPSVAVCAVSHKQKFTVVIDAGHGGRDPGAQDNGVNEKDINLAVAQKLGEFIRHNLKDVNVVLTREKDEYLTLQQRADKANKASGNLFISIHVNSADISNPRRTSAAGASSHVIGQNKDRNNADVVRRENAVIKLEKNYAERYQGFDPDSDESYIIFEMMQKRFQERSLDLAQEIQKQLKTVAGRRDRGVTQEPFWVLWSTSMPAVLVELDFICNPNSAKYIASTQGQNKLAKALFNAVRLYYTQEQTLALQPQQYTQQADHTDGRTYVTENYAIIGNAISPERVITEATMPTRIERRTAGLRRRSAAARLASAQSTRSQQEVCIRTYSEPVAVTSKSEMQTPQQPAHQPTIAPEKNSKQKKGKAMQKNTAAHPAKSAKSNRKRGQRAVVTGHSNSATVISDAHAASTSSNKTRNESSTVAQEPYDATPDATQSVDANNGVAVAKPRCKTTVAAEQKPKASVFTSNHEHEESESGVAHTAIKNKKAHLNRNTH